MARKNKTPVISVHVTREFLKLFTDISNDKGMSKSKLAYLIIEQYVNKEVGSND